MAFMFENLAIYQKAVDFADTIAQLTAEFPRGFFFLADQLNRATLSIAANLAEGNDRFTKADHKNFFTISRGSAQECVPLLECQTALSEYPHSKPGPQGPLCQAYTLSVRALRPR